jgi:hypothetical protein
MSLRLALAVRIALVFGFITDAGVGVLCVVAQPLLAPLLGVPVHDPAITAFLGGELIVASVVYALVFRDLARWGALLWLCALDQTLGVVIPAVQIALGHVPATLQTIGPMPLQLVLVALYVIGGRRFATAATSIPVERVPSEQRPKEPS